MNFLRRTCPKSLATDCFLVQTRKDLVANFTYIRRNNVSARANDLTESVCGLRQNSESYMGCWKGYRSNTIRASENSVTSYYILFQRSTFLFRHQKLLFHIPHFIFETAFVSVRPLTLATLRGTLSLSERKSDFPASGLCFSALIDKTRVRAQKELR